MNRNVFDLLDWDHANRWRILSTSAVFCAVCGYSLERMGYARNTSECGALIAGFVTAGLMVRNYVVGNGPYKSKRARIRASTNLYANWRTPVFISSVLVAILAVSPEVKAALVDAQLRSILAAPQSPIKAAKADHLLRVALMSHVKIRPGLQAAARAQSDLLRNPQVWASYTKVLDGQIAKRSPNTSSEISLANRLDVGAHVQISDSTFSSEVVSYGGGSLSLKNVCFYNVRFQIANTPNGREFAHAIMSSKDNCITIDLP